MPSNILIKDSHLETVHVRIHEIFDACVLYARTLNMSILWISTSSDYKIVELADSLDSKKLIEPCGLQNFEILDYMSFEF